MTHRAFIPSVLAVAAAIAPHAQAQSNISPLAKQAWTENCGWVNFRDAGSPAASQGVQVLGTHLRGYAWGENIGYIDLGHGPANGVSYTNPMGGSVPGVPDFGVNLDPATGALSGYAWAENVGWINFAGGGMLAGSSPARYDQAARRLRGNAWGENIGWVNLDDANSYVGLTCPADFNLDGSVSVQDIFDFLTAWFAGDPRADGGDGGITVQDIFAFLAAWFAGC